MTDSQMTKNSFTIEDLWKEAKFKPNDHQRDAILHSEGPLYLTAGPGSGKTRVLLWRTLNQGARLPDGECQKHFVRWSS